MTTPENLERDVQRLTEWSGPPITNLWERALESSGSEPRTNAGSLLNRPLGSPALLALAACVVIVGLIGLLMPSLGKARQSARQMKPHLDTDAPSAMAAAPRQGMVTWKEGGDLAGASSLGGSADHFRILPESERTSGSVAGASARPADPATRHVIQKATMEIQTPDVRAAFAKAAHLVSVAGGEFVESSSLTGDGKTAQANLTLRVAAARLGEVMNQLRELGEIKAENTTGEDVTSQVVDLEARIRNEQRIEKELLELLDKRADAPLKDVLELRSSLSSVRQTIEQYIGQRDRLGRLVSLASILVVIRAEPENAVKPEPAQSIFTYFTKTTAAAWRDGLRTASDSISWLLGVGVSGIVWWLALGAAIVGVQRYRRRLAARCV